MATTATPLDRELVKRFIIEVDALARFDVIRNGSEQSWLGEHIYGVIEPFESAALGELSEEELGDMRERAIERGEEISRAWAAGLFESEGKGTSDGKEEGDA